MGSFISSTQNLLGQTNNNADFTASGVGQGQLDAAAGNVTNAYAAQQGLAQQLANQNGIGNQSSVFNQQQGLANALQAQANGQGPNPALAQLNQTTGQNVANQAALMAGQRGVGSNAGLAARQIGQQGAATQQQAVGQGATMAAQQQIAAQTALQQQQANMANLSTQQVGQQTSAVGNLNQYALGNQGQLLGLQANQNSANSAMAQTNANNTAKTVGAGLNALGGSGESGIMGGMSSMMSGATGGVVGKTKIGDNPKLAMVPQKDRFPGAAIPPHLKVVADVYHGKKMADGGYVAPTNIENYGGDPRAITNASPLPDPQASASKPKSGDKGSNPMSSIMGAMKPAGGSTPPSAAAPAPNFDDGGYVAPTTVSDPAHASDQAIPDAAPDPSSSGGSSGGGGGGGIMSILPLLAMAAKDGGQVPGKAKVKGDSLKNDTVPAVLSPGEIVIPRHIINSNDPGGNAAKFVESALAKKLGSKKDHSDFKEALKGAMKNRKKA